MGNRRAAEGIRQGIKAQLVPCVPERKLRKKGRLRYLPATGDHPPPFGPLWPGAASCRPQHGAVCPK